MPEHHRLMCQSVCIAVVIQHNPTLSLMMHFSWNLAGVWHWKSADELPSFTELRSNPQHHSSLPEYTNMEIK